MNSKQSLDQVMDTLEQRFTSGTDSLGQVIAILEQRFTSGNSIPVERSTITRAEFDIIYANYKRRWTLDKSIIPMESYRVEDSETPKAI